MPKISKHSGASFEEAPIRIRRAEIGPESSPVDFIAKPATEDDSDTVDTKKATKATTTEPKKATQHKK